MIKKRRGLDSNPWCSCRKASFQDYLFSIDANRSNAFERTKLPGSCPLFYSSKFKAFCNKSLSGIHSYSDDPN